VTEPHLPEQFDAHNEVKRPWHDPLDGRKYVKNVIDWLVKKVSVFKETELDSASDELKGRNNPC